MRAEVWGLLWESNKVVFQSALSIINNHCNEHLLIPIALLGLPWLSAGKEFAAMLETWV